MSAAKPAPEPAEVQQLREALRSCPSETQPALHALLKMFTELGARLGSLADFARDIDAKNADRNVRLDLHQLSLETLELRCAALERRLSELER